MLSAIRAIITYDNNYEQSPDLYRNYDLKEFPREYAKIAEMKVGELESKHVAFCTPKNKKIIESSIKAGYDFTLLGSHRGTKQDSERIQFEIDKIKQMSSDTYSRPIRIVICSNGKIFADNTHWSLAYIARYGKNVKVKDVPCYIVDFTKNTPSLVDINNTIIRNDADMKRAVNCAGKIEQRTLKGWRANNLSSTLSDLYAEIEGFLT